MDMLEIMEGFNNMEVDMLCACGGDDGTVQEDEGRGIDYLCESGCQGREDRTGREVLGMRGKGW